LFFEFALLDRLLSKQETTLLCGLLILFFFWRWLRCYGTGLQIELSKNEQNNLNLWWNIVVFASLNDGWLDNLSPATLTVSVTLIMRFKPAEEARGAELIRRANLGSVLLNSATLTCGASGAGTPRISSSSESCRWAAHWMERTNILINFIWKLGSLSSHMPFHFDLLHDKFALGVADRHSTGGRLDEVFRRSPDLWHLHSERYVAFRLSSF
jgi:hypothetical protein